MTNAPIILEEIDLEALLKEGNEQERLVRNHELFKALQAENHSLKDTIRALRMQPAARTILCDIWRDFLNNYLTSQKYAEINRLHKEHAEGLLYLAELVFSTPERED
jgi:hypothetical protein